MLDMVAIGPIGGKMDGDIFVRRKISSFKNVKCYKLKLTL